MGETSAFCVLVDDATRHERVDVWCHEDRWHGGVERLTGWSWPGTAARPPACSSTHSATTGRRRARFAGSSGSRRGDITAFDVPGAGSLIVQGINDHGQVVGLYVDVGAQPDPDGLLPANTVHGFVRERDGRITTFELPFPYLTKKEVVETEA